MLKNAFTIAIAGGESWTVCKDCRNRTFYIDVASTYLDITCIACKTTIRQLLPTEETNG